MREFSLMGCVFRMREKKLRYEQKIKSKKKEEEKQEHHWLEETQEPAGISFSYPEGTGNAGESANQQ